MIKKIVFGAVLAAISVASQAAGSGLSEWEFSWKGFSVFPGGGMAYEDPGLTVTGKFAGIDGNGDGILALNEVTSLTFKNDVYDYASCPPDSPTFNCYLSSFSYSEAGGLQFEAGHVRYSAAPGSQAWWTADSIDYDTKYGIYQLHFGYQMPGEEYSLSFTNHTVKTVTQISAVPEPATYAMVGAGLLLLAGAQRARRRG